ncbi:S-adenosyl-L-methionine-dependent methyltransferase [Triangularia verruculosa]|uniref:S-adenosyl-L-methionine-dependent methyltransferase n=1 Tax=Triangularia verruculosa TaxID=2587418 RepID=A0AAN6XIK8_9PEZI|nr:S-adenosyl-L-methionine-dependent methyltransferase [Triangularia verruculosa]
MASHSDSKVAEERTFQDPEKYLLPNDKQEKDRLDNQYVLITKLLEGKLAWAPITEPKNVLDVCTGTGIWAIHFARQHPSARVTGVDIDTITPALNPVPSNCTFQSNIDAQDGPWSFAPGVSFDYVHFRMILSCFTQPTKVFQSVFDNLTPGGYIELQDLCVDLQSPDGSASGTSFEKAVNLFSQGSLKTGNDMAKSKNYKRWLEEIGFVDVEERLAEPGLLTTSWHESERDREIGELGRGVFQNFIEKGMPAYLRTAGLNDAEIKELSGKAIAELDSGDVRAYHPFYVVYGRKPLD